MKSLETGCAFTERRVNVSTETELSLGLQITGALLEAPDMNMFFCLCSCKAKVSDWVFLFGAFGSDADLHDAT